MKILATGSIALDDVSTPSGQVKEAIGGSGTYFSYAASFFAPVRLVSVIGYDFPQEHLELLRSRGICLKGVKKTGKTFRWAGSYENDMNEAKTIKTELNAMESFKPELPVEYRKTKYLFLGNIDPELQLDILNQMNSRPKLIALDTMNFWIENKKDELLNVIKDIDLLLLNDREARQLFNTTNLVKAAKAILRSGPKSVIIKKGEHGALLFTESGHFSAPGYPLENLVDPTGAGDSFAGGLLGWLAKTDDLSEPNLRKAVIYGSVIASFNAEGFSLERLQRIKLSDINQRYQEFKRIRGF